jgi:hypothetical protein
MNRARFHENKNVICKFFVTIVSIANLSYSGANVKVFLPTTPTPINYHQQSYKLEIQCHMIYTFLNPIFTIPYQWNDLRYHECLAIIYLNSESTKKIARPAIISP